MSKVQRYTWEDALIDAQTAGVIPNGALLVALKLSKAINWSPKDKRAPGLYWKNDDALEAVGCGRATYFKHRDVLFESGFFTMDKKGNLIPVIPAKSTVETTETDEESTVETKESTVETPQSTVETEKSTGHNPLSVDTFSVDSLSLDDEVTDSADAPSIPTDDKTDGPSLSNEENPALPLSPKEEERGLSNSGEDSRESTVWTVEDYEQVAGEQGVWLEYMRYLTHYSYVQDMDKRKTRAFNRAMKE